MLSVVLAASRPSPFAYAWRDAAVPSFCVAEFPGTRVLIRAPSKGCFRADHALGPPSLPELILLEPFFSSCFCCSSNNSSASACLTEEKPCLAEGLQLSTDLPAPPAPYVTVCLHSRLPDPDHPRLKITIISGPKAAGRVGAAGDWEGHSLLKTFCQMPVAACFLRTF